MLVDDFFWQVIKYLPVSPRTQGNYQHTYLKNLSPFIGQENISLINRKIIVQALNPLPPQSKYATLMTARVLFREALNQELIEYNPASDIKAPSIKVSPKKFLTWEELKCIDFRKQNKRIQFLALHGLRWSEAVALRQSDIYDGLVHINKSKYGKTKSIAGVRNVPLMSEFEEFPLYQNNIAKLLKPYGVTVHSLRKTYAYLLKSSGVHVTTAAKLLGHSNPVVTMKVYTLVRDEEILGSREVMKRYMKDPINERIDPQLPFN